MVLDSNQRCEYLKSRSDAGSLLVLRCREVIEPAIVVTDEFVTLGDGGAGQFEVSVRGAGEGAQAHLDVEVAEQSQ